MDERQVSDSPLTALSNRLAPEMKAVNQTILEQMHSDVPLIPQLAGYLIASGGKRIRPLITLAATSLLDGDMKRAHGLAAAVEFIHTATLLHDDVVDESEERRGKDPANIVFGNQASVLVGDFLFSRAFQLMVSDGELGVLRILSDASAIIAEGEVMQLSMTNDANITMDDYMAIIRAKTAALFAAASEVGPVIAGCDKDTQNAMRDYGLYLGIAFQIADDILDYAADENTLGKKTGDDFREGKMTAPVIIALSKADETERDFWLRTMRDKNQTEDDLKTALSILEKHDALKQSYDLAMAYAQKAKAALPKGQNKALYNILSALPAYAVSRAF